MSCLAGSIQPDCEVLGFSWRSALLKPYDILHVHWPEYLLRGSGRFQSLVSRALFRLLLARLRWTPTEVVRTLHNETPSLELTRTEEQLLEALAKHYRRRLFLRAKQVSADPRDVHLPHGDYRPWLAQLESPVSSQRIRRESSATKRLLCFGILKPYKNFESVIAAVAALPESPEVDLLIAGKPADWEYGQRLLELGDATDRVEVRLERVSDAALVSYLTESDLVVVPYANLNNSGVIFLCVTLGVAVAVPAGQVASELLDEFGPERIKLFEAPLTPAALAQMVDQVGDGPAPGGYVSKERSWDVIGPALAKIYDAAASGN